MTNCIVLIAFVLCSCLWNAQWNESEIKYYLSIYLYTLINRALNNNKHKLFIMDDSGHI